MSADGPTITDWIQAISTVVTGTLALVAYNLSRKAYHAPFRTYLRPIKVGTNDSREFTVTVHNTGPGIAFNVNVYGFYKKIIPPVVDSMVEYQSLITNAAGAQDVKQGTDESYSFSEESVLLDDPIIISWESVTGKKYRTYWIYDKHLSGEYYAQLNWRSALRLRMKYFNIIKSMKRRNWRGRV